MSHYHCSCGAPLSPCQQCQARAAQQQALGQLPEGRMMDREEASPLRIPLPPWRTVLRPMPYLIARGLVIAVVALAAMWRISELS